MDELGYRRVLQGEGKPPGLRIGALASRWLWRLGEGPYLQRGEAYWTRDPFVFTEVKGVSEHLQMPVVGTVDGHNVMLDSTVNDALNVDREVPISPLFARDLCGRTVYLGYGPDRKGNDEWAAYRPRPGADGTVAAEDFNPFAPLVTFPRHCREVAGMEGEDLLESVFLTKFRCLEMSSGFGVVPSGAEDDDTIYVTYEGANLYPYKLRLDTFYTDGWKLPQTQMVFAKSGVGIGPELARKTGEEEILKSWRERKPGTKYEDWLQAKGGAAQAEFWYQRGCTLIPTFEACNGYNVVGEDFSLKDYWPGRAVPGLHEVMEERPHHAPAGTIIHVVTPGFVTADTIRPAQVMVSDGSKYVSPHGNDLLPFLPNVNLPHPRTIASWRATWVPTHPAHFEAPAIWGWELNTGRFLQLTGPLWDPLHYFYGSVDEVLDAYEKPLGDEENRWLVPVPDHMKNRFYPVVPMRGFDTFSEAEYRRRQDARILPRSCIKRVETAEAMAGVGYHPMPPEFEFELDTFWFPELHPLNREQGDCPEFLLPLVAPVVASKVAGKVYLPTVEGFLGARAWLADEERLMTPEEDIYANYPYLVRYLLPDMELDAVMTLCPLPYLGNVGDLLGKPASLWWVDAGGRELDGKAALDTLVPGLHDAVWDARQNGVEIIKIRHMIYQSEEMLYIIAWWFGAGRVTLEQMMADWVTNRELREQGLEAPTEQQQQAAAVEKVRGEQRAAAPQVGMAEDEENG